MDGVAWFGLGSVPGVGPQLFRRLLERFGSPAQALSASPGELAAVPGFGPALAATLRRHDWQAAGEAAQRQLTACGGRLLTWDDAGYPPLLRAIPDPPPFLCVRGDWAPGQPAVAVVGSRRASAYGREMATRLAGELAAAGVLVVSGLARGIDSAAHRSALAAGGRSVAVLGSGLDRLYPPENLSLAEELVTHGGLVSEFPPGVPPLPEHFPRRNRLVSGLCHGVLVVEAASGSGSLLTARYALEQGREVFAVPGNVTSPGSAGCHALLQEGATLVTCAADLLAALPGYAFPKGSPSAAREFPLDLPAEERLLLELLLGGPLQFDALAAGAGLTGGELSVMVTRLELAGLVHVAPGKILSVK